MFTRFSVIGRLPKPLQAQLEPEGVVYVAEKVGVRRRFFSGSVPGRHDAAEVDHHVGLVVFTCQRLYALLPTLQRLKQPAIDQQWAGARGGPAKVAICESGVHPAIDLPQVDPWFHGDMSLHFPVTPPNDVLASLASRSLAFPVSAEYVFHMLGVRARR